MIFLIVTLFGSLVATIILSQSMKIYRIKTVNMILDTYFSTIYKLYNETGDLSTIDGLQSIGYVIYHDDDVLVENSTLVEGYFGDVDVLVSYCKSLEPSLVPVTFIVSKGFSDYYFYYMTEEDLTGTFVVFTDKRFADGAGYTVPRITNIVLILIIIFSNIVLFVFGHILVGRIKRVKTNILDMQAKNNSFPLPNDGIDELSDLVTAVENMRQKINKSNTEKEEMLQNISHDLKTPIAVIKSYSEAVLEGVEGVESLQKVITHADILAIKVRQLIEFTKLEHLKDVSEFTEVDVARVVKNVVKNQKRQSKITFELDLDDSKYYGIEENYYMIFNNIIDNALRFAETTIKITLKDNVLEFYNDGPRLQQKFLDGVFKPYEKGKGGEFGLGLAIVYRTLQQFHYSIEAKNRRVGVSFIITPY